MTINARRFLKHKQQGFDAARLFVGSFLVAAFCFSNAQATIYKCKKDGVLTFSQHPCSANAEEYELKQNKRMLNDKAGLKSHVEQQDKISDTNNKLEFSRLSRKYKRLMAENEKSIRIYQKQKREKLAEIRAKKRHARSVLTHAEYEEERKIALENIEFYYAQKIRIAKSNIRKFKKQLQKMAEQ